MSRSLAAAVLLAVALVASAAASEDSNLVEDGAVSVSVSDAANVTAAELTGNKTRPKEDTFADMIDRALEKEFTENEDHNEGFVRSQLLCSFYLASLSFLGFIFVNACFVRVSIGVYSVGEIRGIFEGNRPFYLACYCS